MISIYLQPKRWECFSCKFESNIGNCDMKVSYCQVYQNAPRDVLSSAYERSVIVTEF